MATTKADLAQIKLSDVKSLSSSVVEKLESMSINTALDLLELYPRRYLDRTKQLKISELVPGEEATFYGVVEAISSRRTKNRKSLVQAVVADGQARIKISFFNQAWRAKQLKVSTEAAFFGKVNDYKGNIGLINPLVDIIREGSGSQRTGVFLPLYPQSPKENLSTSDISKAIIEVLKLVEDLAEILNKEILDELKLIPRAQAYRFIHTPENDDEARKGARRLRFDEFLMLQMIMVSKYLLYENSVTSLTLPKNEIEQKFINSLPFELTNSQKTAIKTIDEEMSSNHPMHRLLQGDVGSGKTVVALAGVARAASNDAQSIFLSPTEVLANQHFESAKKLFKGIEKVSTNNLFSKRDFAVEILTSSTSAKKRNEIIAKLESGEIDLLISTHAVLYHDINFHNLGLVIVDEQHRFGVDQRSALIENREVRPHLIAMSATPIPRTAAMLYFGDLKNTIMKDMPKDRLEIKTKIARTKKQRESAYKKVRSEIENGRQAYVVCALVNESDKIEAASAVEHIERLKSDELSGINIGLVHGQMSSQEKDAVMSQFKNGEIKVLVSTTVIEVGIDVPNASVMVVEDADRFGLSQLHQLRGRVGRGQYQSYCFLLSEKSSNEVQNRLGAMEKTSDGFELSEIDLELRGAGHILGGIQSGVGDLKLGKLPRDAKYVEYAKDVATRILKNDPQMASIENKTIAIELKLNEDFQSYEYIFKS
ncbi:MAG: ATP-dependent DNA helicase RecG [Acidimicrobiia bacterium]